MAQQFCLLCAGFICDPDNVFMCLRSCTRSLLHGRTPQPPVTQVTETQCLCPELGGPHLYAGISDSSTRGHDRPSSTVPSPPGRSASATEEFHPNRDPSRAPCSSAVCLRKIYHCSVCIWHVSTVSKLANFPKHKSGFLSYHTNHISQKQTGFCCGIFFLSKMH